MVDGAYKIINKVSKAEAWGMIDKSVAKGN